MVGEFSRGFSCLLYRKTGPSTTDCVLKHDIYMPTTLLKIYKHHHHTFIVSCKIANQLLRSSEGETTTDLLARARSRNNLLR